MSTVKDVEEQIMSVFLLNVRGLTVNKWNEWEEIMNGEKSKVRITMFTETQHKVEKIDFGNNYVYEVGMRNEEDKKGGGLMIGSRDEVKVVKVESGHADVLCVDIEIKNRKMRMILTYCDVRDGNRNERIVTCIKNIVEIHEGKLMLLGDMNAHVGILGQQEMNGNGEKLLNLMDDCGLIMLNLDETCIGVTTREENGHESVIDFVLVNGSLYEDFDKMVIDEEKAWFDLSDHCMIK